MSWKQLLEVREMTMAGEGVQWKPSTAQAGGQAIEIETCRFVWLPMGKWTWINNKTTTKLQEEHLGRKQYEETTNNIQQSTTNKQD